MAEYLAPGVYVEETSFRAKSIEGVGTSTAAFVGPTRRGPLSGGEDAPERPELLTSFGDFERIYGGLADLVLDGEAVPNYLAHAALAYFNEGGSRLYVARTSVLSAEEGDGGATRGSVTVLDGADAAASVVLEARFPGEAGNGAVTFIETLAPASDRTMVTAPGGTLILTGEGEDEAYHVKRGDDWFPADDPEAEAADIETLAGDTPRIVSLLVIARDGDGSEMVWENVGLHPDHPRAQIGRAHV